MIERIQIEGFQRHDRLRVVFDPRVTCVTGPSDAGKSSLLRALRWVLLNQPDGESFVREGSDAARCSLWFDGSRVRRAKGKANTYWLGAEEFKAFGRGVPDPIKDLANVDDVNFSGQHEPPFWFTLTPGELAKRINAIVDLSAIDDALADAASRVRKAKAEEEVCEKRLAEADAEVEELAWVGEMVADLDAVETKQTKRDDLAAQAAALRVLTEDLAANAQAADGAADAASGAEDDLSMVADLLRKARDAAKEQNALVELIREMEAAEDKCRISRNQRDAAILELSEAGDVTCPTCGRLMDDDKCV